MVPWFVERDFTEDVFQSNINKKAPLTEKIVDQLFVTPDNCTWHESRDN